MAAPAKHFDAEAFRQAHMSPSSEVGREPPQDFSRYKPCSCGWKSISSGIGTYFSALGKSIHAIFSSSVLLKSNEITCMQVNGIVGIVVGALAVAAVIGAVALLMFPPVGFPIGAAVLALTWKIAAGVAGGSFLLTALSFYGASKSPYNVELK